MRLVSFAWRGFLFFLTVFGLTSSIGYLVDRERGAVVLSLVTALGLLTVALRWKTLWVKALRARRVQVLDGIEVYYLNDPSSHVFIMASPFRSGGTVFMTRGVLSLLDSEELEELLNYSVSHLQQTGLGWETFLSCIQLTLLNTLHPSVRKFFYKGTLAGDGLPYVTLFRALPTLGFLDLIRRLYLPEAPLRAIQVSRKKVVFERLLAESLVCPPQLPSALAPHAMVSPWPSAILRTGRSCLASQASLTSLP